MVKLTILLVFLAQLVVAETKEFTVTAYCACEKCCGKWSQYHKTADGHTPVEGVTCAASRSIPFGTKLLLEGIGERIVQDRLATRFDSRIDIFFNSHQRALEFGKKKVKVLIILVKPPTNNVSNGN